ncbi:9787_t:CDS:1, partial [Ambispora gerdemannii]
KAREAIIERAKIFQAKGEDVPEDDLYLDTILSLSGTMVLAWSLRIDKSAKPKRTVLSMSLN